MSHQEMDQCRQHNMEATRYLVIFKVMNPATVTPTQDSDTEDDFNEVPAMEGAVEKMSDLQR